MRHRVIEVVADGLWRVEADVVSDGLASLSAKLKKSSVNPRSIGMAGAAILAKL